MDFPIENGDFNILESQFSPGIRGFEVQWSPSSSSAFGIFQLLRHVGQVTQVAQAIQAIQAISCQHPSTGGDRNSI